MRGQDIWVTEDGTGLTPPCGVMMVTVPGRLGGEGAAPCPHLLCSPKLRVAHAFQDLVQPHPPAMRRSPVCRAPPQPVCLVVSSEEPSRTRLAHICAAMGTFLSLACPWLGSLPCSCTRSLGVAETKDPGDPVALWAQAALKPLLRPWRRTAATQGPRGLQGRKRGFQHQGLPLSM